MSENVPLAECTTFGIGGQARYFAEATSSEVLRGGVAWAKSQGLPLFVLGGGSNILVADDGFPGLVLRVRIRGLHSRIEGDKVTLTAGAGEDWDKVVAACISNNWAGFECLSGIPGSVGATPIQNVGAYGQEISETFVSLEALDLERAYLVTMTPDECEFGYRTSRFKTRERDRFIITSVTYRLTADGRPTIRYLDLQLYFKGGGIKSPALSDVREAVLAIRRSKAMVIDIGDPDSRSVGSFFVNPVVTREAFEEIKKRARSFIGSDKDIPSYSASSGRVKLSAAWLIERAGFERGYTYGNVGISQKHALAIINRGGGTAREVVELAGRIKLRVRSVFGVTLVPEPVFVGFDR